MTGRSGEVLEVVQRGREWMCVVSRRHGGRLEIQSGERKDLPVSVYLVKDVWMRIIMWVYWCQKWLN